MVSWLWSPRQRINAALTCNGQASGSATSRNVSTARDHHSCSLPRRKLSTSGREQRKPSLSSLLLPWMRAAYLLRIFRARNWRYQISLVAHSNSSSAHGLMMSLMVSGRWRPRNDVCSATRDCWRQWRTAGLSQTLPRERIRRNQLRSRACTGAAGIVGVREAGRLGAREVDPASASAYSFIEPHENLTRRQLDRRALGKQVSKELAQLARSKRLAERVAASQEIVNLLAESDEYETRRIEQVKQRLWLVGDVLPLDLGCSEAQQSVEPTMTYRRRTRLFMHRFVRAWSSTMLRLAAS